MNNPFSLSFSKVPVNVISREKQINEIVGSFSADNPEYQVCMITGVRGSGKTVFMTEVSSVFKKDKNWIVLDLVSERDLLRALAAELSNQKELMQIFKDAKINLSFLGFGLEIDSEPPITDIAVAIDRMLNQLTKKGKKVLVTVDEVVSNQYVREFTSQFQVYLRKNYHVFLLMTGLYENIYELQNEEALTFLYRAPKVFMEPLNTLLIAKEYKSVFQLSDEVALEMADVVKGYPYAYQVLGYLCYKKQAPYQDVLDEFDAYLYEYVYEKIWKELSPKDREVMHAISNSTQGKISEVCQLAHMASNELSVYRNRLLRKGLIVSPSYGYVAFALPRFKEFIDTQML